MAPSDPARVRECDRQRADDVVRTASALPRPPVLVGHSMGGLVVQQALARCAARAAVLVAPVPKHPAVASLVAIARRHPLDALRIVADGSLPLRPDYLFHELDDAEGRRLADRCGGESAVVQYQLLMHRPAKPPLGAPPVLVLATPDDQARADPGRPRHGRPVRRPAGGVPRDGHDLVLDARWRQPLEAMLTWLAAQPALR